MLTLIEVANAGINTFGTTSPEADVQPSEEPIFVLSSSQLQEIIAGAIQPLQDRIDSLEDRIIKQDEKIAALESTQDLQAENAFIQLKLINDLRKKDPGKTEISRAEKIEKYLMSRPDHKATFETLKGHLGINKDRLLEAVKTLMDSSPGRYGIIRTPGDKRKRTLIMLPK